MTPADAGIVTIQSSLATFGAGLASTLLLVPALRVAIASARRPAAARRRRRVVPAVGGSSVMLGVLLLVPMGGDGLFVAWSDARLGAGLCLAVGLFVLACTPAYRALPGWQRVLLHGLFALGAVAAGLRPAGSCSELAAFGIGAAWIVGCTHALGAFARVDGLAAGCGAIAATFVAVASLLLGAPDWGDLDLGLAGALLALLAYELSGGRFRATLGEAGSLGVGFLLGLACLRLAESVHPAARPAFALLLAPPALELALQLAHRFRPRHDAAPELHLHAAFCRLGLSPFRATVLLWSASAVSGLAALRLLGLLA